MRLRLPIVFILACCATMTQATEIQSYPVPPGWVHDYDYSSSLRLYLAAQAQEAERAGVEAYAYFFDDEDSHCQSLRKLLDKPHIAEVFSAARIVMLNSRHFKNLHAMNPEEGFDPAWTPLMVKISDVGMLTEPVIYPDLYLYHPYRIPEKRIRVRAITWRTNKGTMEEIFAKRMVEFLSVKANVIEPKKVIVEKRSSQH